jgi:hypothetical protein
MSEQEEMKRALYQTHISDAVVEQIRKQSMAPPVVVNDGDSEDELILESDDGGTAKKFKRIAVNGQKQDSVKEVFKNLSDEEGPFKDDFMDAAKKVNLSDEEGPAKDDFMDAVDEEGPAKDVNLSEEEEESVKETSDRKRKKEHKSKKEKKHKKHKKEKKHRKDPDPYEDRVLTAPRPSPVSEPRQLLGAIKIVSVDRIRDGEGMSKRRIKFTYNGLSEDYKKRLAGMENVTWQEPGDDGELGLICDRHELSECARRLEPDANLEHLLGKKRNEDAFWFEIKRSENYATVRVRHPSPDTFNLRKVIRKDVTIDWDEQWNPTNNETHFVCAETYIDTVQRRLQRVADTFREDADHIFFYRITKFQDEEKMPHIQIWLKHEYYPSFDLRAVIPSDISFSWDQKWDERTKSTTFSCKGRYTDRIVAALIKYVGELNEKVAKEEATVQEDLAKLTRSLSRADAPKPKQFAVPGVVDINDYTLKQRFKVYLVHIWRLEKDQGYSDLVEKVKTKADNNRDRALDHIQFIDIKETLILYDNVVNTRLACMKAVFSSLLATNKNEGLRYQSLMGQCQGLVSYTNEPFSDITTDVPLSEHYITQKQIRNQQGRIVTVYSDKTRKFFLCETWFAAVKSGISVMYHPACLSHLSNRFKKITDASEFTDEEVSAHFKVLGGHFTFFRELLKNSNYARQFGAAISLEWSK